MNKMQWIAAAADNWADAGNNLYWRFAPLVLNVAAGQTAVVGPIAGTLAGAGSLAGQVPHACADAGQIHA